MSYARFGVAQPFLTCEYMFESITIKAKQVDGLLIDPGFVAECLLFYRTVNLLADRVTLPGLLDVFGVQGVKELVSLGRLNLFIREDIFGVMEFPDESGIAVGFDIQLTSGERISHENTLVECIGETQGSAQANRKAVDDLLALSKPYRYSKLVAHDIADTLKNQDFLAKSIAETVNFWNPDRMINAHSIQSKYEFKGNYGPFKMHEFSLNIDPAQYTNVTPSGILLNIAEAIGDVHIAAGFDSEIADNAIYTSIIQHKIESLAAKSRNSQEDISAFQNMVLSRHRTIAEAVRNKLITFQQFVSLLEKADKFREWLYGLEPDSKILAEYYEALVADTWADKLPTKGVRFAFFTGAGLALDSVLGGLGTVIGTVLGVADTFVLDKLIKGWKPNQFVEEQLKKSLPMR